MSLTHAENSTAVGTPPPLSWWRCFRFPIIVLAVLGLIFALPWILLALNLEFEWALQFNMASQWGSIFLAIVLIGGWWLFFSPFSWGTRMIPVGLMVAVCVAGAVFAALAVRKIEFTKGGVGLVPRIHFVWDLSPQEQHAEFIKNQSSDGLPAIDANIGADDFPRFRGVNFDGRVKWARLETDWKKHPPKELWQHTCPGGYSGMAVAGNIVVTVEQRDEGETETVACYDRATGRPRWSHTYKAARKDIMGDGPRATPTIHDGHVYSLGATGVLVCLDALGNVKWEKNILKDAKAENIKWGMTGSPLIVDDLVIAHAGTGPEATIDSALIAYEQAKGKIRWQAGNHRAGYSSPQLATLAGKPQILLFDAAGLNGHDPKTGKELWKFPWVTMEDMNSIQPVVVGDDRVFISSEAPLGCAMLRIKAPENDKGSWSVETVWKNKKLAARYANPVTDGKRIFGLHILQGVLKCLDAENGEVLWTGNREGPGQLLLADGVLLVVNGDTGDVALFDANASECTELARHQVFTTRDKTWNTPALAGDQLFVRNQSFIACLKLPRK